MTSEVDKQAAAYEADIAPRWLEPFARLLVTAAPVDPRGTVLDVMCGTGTVALALLEKLETRGRVVALDPSNGLLDLARRKSGSHLGKRLFFRHERLEKLSFADEVFDLVVSNAGVLELADPSRALAESVRVTKAGGALAMTLCLRGTLQEVMDLLREVLERHEREDLLVRLEDHILSYPSDNEAIARFEGLGLRDVTLVRSSFPVEYPTGKAFLGSALVSQRFLSVWTEMLGKDDAPLILGDLAATLDTYFGLDAFEVTVQAACLVGRKEAVELAHEVGAAEEAPAAGSGPREAPAAPEPEVAQAEAPPSAASEVEEVTPVREIPIPPEASGVGEAPAEDASASASTPLVAAPEPPPEGAESKPPPPPVEEAAVDPGVPPGGSSPNRQGKREKSDKS